MPVPENYVRRSVQATSENQRKPKMELYELVYVIDQCNQMAATDGMLPAKVAHVCFATVETLKEVVGNGDYNEYRKWWDEFAAFILEKGKL